MVMDSLLADPTMRALVQRYGDLALRERPAFEVLTRSIIAQQISTKAADTIRARYINHFGAKPEAVANARLPSLRALGLSETKSVAIREVARRAQSGSLDVLSTASNDRVIEHLTAISGVGPWTAQMFLIFSLARPDVWPVADAGLRQAVRGLYNDGRSIHEIGVRFQPNRSLAALYLWRSLENTAPAPEPR
jgi:DNA-3-methyladenine glycosylase II